MHSRTSLEQAITFWGQPINGQYIIEIVKNNTNPPKAAGGWYQILLFSCYFYLFALSLNASSSGFLFVITVMPAAFAFSIAWS